MIFAAAAARRVALFSGFTTANPRLYSATAPKEARNRVYNS